MVLTDRSCSSHIVKSRCQPLEHLHISLSQYFPPDRCLMSQNLGWVKGSFEMWTSACIPKKLFKFSSLFQIPVSKVDFLHVLPLKDIITTDWIQRQIGESSQTLERFAKLKEHHSCHKSLLLRTERGLPRWRWWLQPIHLPTQEIWDMSLIPRSGRSPGGGRDNPQQYSCLEKPMDRGAWWAIVHKGLMESDTTEVT